MISRDNLRAQTAQKRKTCQSTLLDTTKDSIARTDYGSSTSNVRLVSCLKGDLIRQNVVNRQDLMRSYKRPPKKSELPQNNPFYAKTLAMPSPYTISQKASDHDALYERLFSNYGHEKTLDFLRQYSSTPECPGVPA